MLNKDRRRNLWLLNVFKQIDFHLAEVGGAAVVAGVGVPVVGTPVEGAGFPEDMVSVCRRYQRARVTVVTDCWPRTPQSMGRIMRVEGRTLVSSRWREAAWYI